MKRQSSRLDLHSVRHDGCLNCANREEREANEEDGLCAAVVAVSDGLPVRCVGPWAYDKIYRLVKYFGIFTQGMKNLWSGKLNYIEICSGPGRCIVRRSREEIDGTPLAILNSPGFQILNRALFIDSSQTVVDALNRRIQVVPGAGAKAQAVIGDYKDTQGVGCALAMFPKDHLNLVLLDPTNCDVPFETVRAIDRVLGRVDFIINVAVGTDANRNLAMAVLDPRLAGTREKYDAFLGTPGFCTCTEVKEAAVLNDHRELRRLFTEEYKSNLARLGYCHTDIRPVQNYYYLLFASKKEQGLKFWRKACTYAPSGQKELALDT